MDVKTGVVGVNRRISHQSIAEQLYIELHQGIQFAPCKLIVPRGFLRNLLISLVSRAGFEPATCPLGGGCAIQLCHRDLIGKFTFNVLK